MFSAGIFTRCAGWKLARHIASNRDAMEHRDVIRFHGDEARQQHRRIIMYVYATSANRAWPRSGRVCVSLRKPGKTESEVRRLRRRMLKAKWQATNSDKNFVYGVYANREPRTRLRGCCATRSSTKYHAVKTTIKIPELAELGQALFINQAEPENRVNSLKSVRCIPRRVS